MSSKRNKTFKSRRSFDRDAFFAKKNQREEAILQFILEREFPDPKERKEYLRNLMRGLETEPILENQNDTLPQM